LEHYTAEKEIKIGYQTCGSTGPKEKEQGCCSFRSRCAAIYIACGDGCDSQGWRIRNATDFANYIPIIKVFKISLKVNG